MADGLETPSAPGLNSLLIEDSQLIPMHADRDDRTDIITLRRHALGAGLLVCAGLPIGVLAAACEPGGDTRIWVSPQYPRAGAAVKMMAVATAGPPDELVWIDAHGERFELDPRALGGPPWSLSVELAQVDAGSYRVEARRDGMTMGCTPVDVMQRGATFSPSASAALAWNESTEAFYSAWIERLFDFPPDQPLSFPSLEPLLRDSTRNFLFDYLGWDEDHSLPATPDCADLPYTLRAYFAWKVGLPIGFRACSRGSANSPPRCGPAMVKTEFTHGIRPASTFKSVRGQLIDAVHSGSARTALDDDATDLYPVELSRQTLWPGTVYADPYGHVLVLVQWVPQTSLRPGLLLAVDAQPDNSVSRKRFWEGTFLFANVASAGPGFKAFRPLMRDAAGIVRGFSNGVLVDAAGFAPFSLEQDALSPDDFYARVGQLINPAGLDPRQAYEATLDALVEQLETRVISIGNGEAYFRKNPAGVIAMPEGAAIFETVGPWEDFSTPSRDLRLIIAMNVLTGLAEKVVRHPELFVMQENPPERVEAEIERLHESRTQQRKIRYTRSDGSSWELSVADVLARKPMFETAYNPNDCAEARWGAQPGTEEYRPCRRHAPPAQRARMERYREWFRQARRPTR
jgi:hypothetical protein